MKLELSPYVMGFSGFDEFGNLVNYIYYYVLVYVKNDMYEQPVIVCTFNKHVKYTFNK